MDGVFEAYSTMVGDLAPKDLTNLSPNPVFFNPNPQPSKVEALGVKFVELSEQDVETNLAMEQFQPQIKAATAVGMELVLGLTLTLI